MHIFSKRLNRYEFVEEIITGGSDRKFYRIKKDKKTYILIEDKNINDYVKILRHLLSIGVGVPKLIEVKKDYAIVEDLGNDSLYSLMCNGFKDWIKFYKKSIEELVKLQVDGYK
ncbi:MAG: hypothetical protein ABIL07_06220, partial [candidate division WOR-3 bacterium]